MRKIQITEILIFTIHLTLILLSASVAGVLSYHSVPWQEFRAIVSVIVFVLAMYLAAIAAYRIYFYFFPMQEGEIPPGSAAESRHNISVLYLTIFFRFLTQSKIVIIPLTGIMYRALGARVGENTYFAGHLLDPLLTKVGSNTIIGHDSVVYTHSIEGSSLSQQAVTIGDGVTIGAMSIVMGGVSIGDNAIVAVGSVVRKGTIIGEGETWGGVPAKLLRKQLSEADIPVA